jgi:hypothetical protein
MYRIRTLLIATLVLASAAHAQLPAKEAEKQLKAAIHQTLETWQGSVDQALQGLAAQQAAFDKKLKGGLYTTSNLDADVVFYLDQADRTIMLATLDGAHSAETKAAALLDDLAGPGIDLHGVLPAGFQTGSGGELDGLRTGMCQTLQHSYAKLAKHLKKTAKLMEGAGVRMNFRLAPPCMVHDAAVNQSKAQEFTSWPPLCVDTVLAASQQTVTGDGFLVVSGSADPAKGKITVTLKSAPLTPGGADVTKTYDVTVITNFRWVLEVPALAEGNWVISATQGTGSPIVTACIGMP